MGDCCSRSDPTRQLSNMSESSSMSFSNRNTIQAVPGPNNFTPGPNYLRSMSINDQSTGGRHSVHSIGSDSSDRASQRLVQPVPNRAPNHGGIPSHPPMPITRIQSVPAMVPSVSNPMNPMNPMMNNNMNNINNINGMGSAPRMIPAVSNPSYPSHYTMVNNNNMANPLIRATSPPMGASYPFAYNNNNVYNNNNNGYNPNVAPQTVPLISTVGNTSNVPNMSLGTVQFSEVSQQDPLSPDSNNKLRTRNIAANSITSATSISSGGSTNNALYGNNNNNNNNNHRKRSSNHSIHSNVSNNSGGGISTQSMGSAAGSNHSSQHMSNGTTNITNIQPQQIPSNVTPGGPVGQVGVAPVMSMQMSATPFGRMQSVTQIPPPNLGRTQSTNVINNNQGGYRRRATTHSVVGNNNSAEISMNLNQIQMEMKKYGYPVNNTGNNNGGVSGLTSPTQRHSMYLTRVSSMDDANTPQRSPSPRPSNLMKKQESILWETSEMGKMSDDMGKQLKMLEEKMVLKKKLDNGTITTAERETLNMIEHLLSLNGNDEQ